MKCDFLITYEHNSRELENACLLKVELEKRGYTVEIAHFLSAANLFLEPKVVLTPFLYNNELLSCFTCFRKTKIRKIINLQYEQVLTPNWEKGGYHNPKDEAKYAQHVVWGEKIFNRLVSAGVPKKNLHLIGHIGMDLNFPEFSHVFYSKQELANRYDLDVKSEWHLFISTFSYCNVSKETVEREKKRLNNFLEFKSLEDTSQEEILNWIESGLKKFCDKTFIYRPHPSENKSERLKRLQEEYPNFRCISDYSIRQWIKVSDCISTWFSTSIADIYYSGKACIVLRPFPINKDDDLVLFHDVNSVNSIDEYFSYLEDSGSYKDFPIGQEIIESYYGCWRDGKAYKRLADLCIKVLGDDNYAYDFTQSYPKKHTERVKLWVRGILVSLCQYIKISRISRIIAKSEYTNMFNDVERSILGAKKLKKVYLNNFRQMEQFRRCLDD